MQHRKTCTATSKIFVLQHRKICASSSKIIYCNISSSSTATLQKTSITTTQNPIATFENHLLQHPKNPIATREKQKKTYKTAPGTSPLSLPEGGGNRTPELAGTLATAASLRFRGGGGLGSRDGPTYLVGAAAIILVSGGGRTEVAEGESEGRQRTGARARPGERRATRQRVGAEERGVEQVSRANKWVWRATGWDKESVDALSRVVMCAGPSGWDGRPYNIIIV
jgi:hypothetical protein